MLSSPKSRQRAPRLGWALSIALSACTHEIASPVDGEATSQPEGYKDGVALSEAVDQNTDPDIVEFNIEARSASLELTPGVKTDVLTYNGSLPGPMLRAKVGNRVIVHFKNELEVPTTLHWHGVRVPVNMDGAPPTSQAPVMPGGTFDYDFQVPDAGLFWYHPHVDSANQVNSGLYGTLVVEDPSESTTLGDEVILVLSDIDLEETGNRRNQDGAGTLGYLFGLEGNTILVNGRTRPHLLARAGLRQRWRLVNSAKARYFQLALTGQTFTRIGGDGGLIEAPVEMTKVVIAPGERIDVSVAIDAPPGTNIPLRWLPFDRGFGSAEGRNPETILTVQVDTTPTLTPAALPIHLRSIEPLDTSAAQPQSVRLTYGSEESGGALLINGKAYDEMLMAHVGDTDLWTVTNETDWNHPFHLHGFFIQPIDANGQITREWKDTIDVPFRQTRQFVVRYADRPGTWMFHCHILEHAEIGMMGMLMLHE